MKHSYTICPHCGCGCGLHLVRQDGAAGGVTASLNHPFNQGQLCARGWTCHQMASAPARITEPLLRRAAQLEPSTWREAASHAAKRLKTIRDKHGPDSIGVIGSPRLTTQELFALRHFSRDVLGTPHYDSGARLTGFPVEFPKPAALADLDKADLIVVIGANLLEDNPILGAKVLSLCKPATDRPYVSPDIAHAVPAAPIALALIGTRATALAAAARPFIKPRPGSEPQLLLAFLKILIENQRRASADPGFVKLKENLGKLSAKSLLDGTGIQAAQLESLAAQLAAAKAPLFVIGRDPLQAPGARAAAAALANLALICGDRLSVLCAATGANDYAALRVAASRDGMSYMEMVGALRKKKLRALVLAGEDPLLVLPGRTEAAAALGAAEFILSIDSFIGPAQDCAHAVLPLAIALEKAGSFFALDGNEQPFRAAAKPAGQARPLDAILRDLAAPFRAKAARDTTMAIGTIDAIDPMKWYEAPRTSPDRILLELGSVYPFLYGGDGLAANSYHLAREFTGGYIELNPEDIAALGVRAGWKVKVVSAAASLEAPVRSNPAVMRGTAFMPVHFGGNALAPFAYDGTLKTPVLRGIPVTIEKI